jgi:hypothetical protein
LAWALEVEEDHDEPYASADGQADFVAELLLLLQCHLPHIHHYAPIPLWKLEDFLHVGE